MAPTRTAPPTPGRRAATETSGVGVPSGIGCHAFWLLFVQLVTLAGSFTKPHYRSAPQRRGQPAGWRRQPTGPAAVETQAGRSGQRDSIGGEQDVAHVVGVGRGAVVSGQSRPGRRAAEDGHEHPITVDADGDRAAHHSPGPHGIPAARPAHSSSGRTDRESRRMRARPRPGGHMDGHPEDLRGSS